MSDPLLTDAERTQSQGKRLKMLRERLDVSKGRLMDTLGLKTTNGYDLYERGQSVIRFNQVAEWATAFGISEQQFVEEVLEPPDPEWDFLSELRAALPQAPWYADELHGQYKRESIAAQRVLVDFVRDALEADRLTIPPQRRDARIADERAEYVATRPLS